ncbi:MAG: hypothetical protein G3M70_12640 [Candidatus Nitronauta litoralis]|uniref:Uncharacterized protein n=1 Tax=Candidatus Nitronauta litoralis TaxID=2705533 RepID=A0A7T0BXI9_9BACT|nr:MAG: hypothetical protein G3M70_12640 [Candidatus Nitronauta litoralis]
MADPPDIDIERRLEDLHTAANKLNIEVVFSDLSDPEFPAKSGLCKIHGRDIILLDRTLPPAQQIEVLLETLRQFDLETIFLAAWIRDRLERPET